MAKIYIGQTVRFSYPRADVIQCDGITGINEGNNISATFIIDGESPDTQIGESEYFVTHIFTNPGKHVVTLEVDDTGRGNAYPQRISADVYVNNICDVPTPTYPNGIAPNPAQVTSTQLKDGVEITWTPASPDAIINCSNYPEVYVNPALKYQEIKVIAKFPDGAIEAVPDENGKIIIKKKLTGANFPSSPVQCDLAYFDPNTQTVKTIFNAIILYMPSKPVSSGTEIPDQCHYSQGSPTIKDNVHFPGEITVGEETAFSINASLIESCNGYTAQEQPNQFQVTLIADGKSYLAVYDPSSQTFIANVSFDAAGNKTIVMEALDIQTSAAQSTNPTSVYVSNICSLTDPAYPKEISADPAKITDKDLVKANADGKGLGIDVTWKPASGASLLNCDGSVKNMKVTAKFPGGNVEVIPDENGDFSIVKRINPSNLPKSAVKCDLEYFDPNASKAKTIQNAITLYPPIVSTDIDVKDQCYYSNNKPTINGDIQLFPTQPVAGEPTTFLFPASLIQQCNGITADDPAAKVKVTFIIENIEHEAVQSADKKTYSVSVPFTASGNKVITMIVDDLDKGTSQQIQINQYVKAAEIEAPLASLTGPFAAEKKTNVQFMAVNPNESKFSYTWEYGDGKTAAGAVATPPANYDTAGTYQVRLTAAKLDDPTIKSQATQNITIIPSAEQGPCASDPRPKAYTIIGPSPKSGYSPGGNLEWDILAYNCDMTTTGITAECIFDDPDNPVVGTINETTGFINIATAFKQELGGQFLCKLWGPYSGTDYGTATLWPPYYAGQ